MLTDDARLDGLIDLVYGSAKLATCPHCEHGFYPMAGSGLYECPECGAGVVIQWNGNVLVVRKTDFDAYASDEQKAFISRNPHLIPAIHLGRQNFIVRDTGKDETGRHFGPYVLTSSCRLVEINHFLSNGKGA